MNPRKRERLAAAGWQVGDAGDFLGLTDEERQLIDLRLTLGRAVRRLRESRGLSQDELAARMKSSQSRVAKIEVAGKGVSLDLQFRALFAAGGRIGDLVPLAAVPPPRPTRRKPAAS